jgi:hypothetical protein
MLFNTIDDSSQSIRDGPEKPKEKKKMPLISMKKY